MSLLIISNKIKSGAYRLVSFVIWKFQWYLFVIVLGIILIYLINNSSIQKFDPNLKYFSVKKGEINPEKKLILNGENFRDFDFDLDSSKFKYEVIVPIGPNESLHEEKLIDYNINNKDLMVLNAKNVRFQVKQNIDQFLPLTYFIEAQNIFYSNSILKPHRFSLTSRDELSFVNCNFAGYFNEYSNILSPYSLIFNSKFSNVSMEILSGTIEIENLELDSINTMYINSEVILGNLTGKGTLEFKMNPKSHHVGSIPIIIKELDFSRLKVHEGIRFFPDTSLSDNVKIHLYNQLVQHFAELEKEKAFYDTQLQRLIYKQKQDWLTPFVREKWNNFGYDKNLIFINSFLLLLLFFSINLLVYPKIVYEGYSIKLFKYADEQLIQKYRNRNIVYKLLNAWYCLIFTFFIFWGLKLNLESLKISKIGYTILILSQYIIGLICLAYIANIIITK